MNMIKLSAAVLALAFFGLLLTACDMEPKTYSEEITQMKDTLFKTFPSVNRVSVEVRNDFGNVVNITLGDAQLYNASAAKQEEVVQKTTALTEHIFASAKPKKGNVIFVKEENTINVKEEDKKVFPMPLQAE